MILKSPITGLLDEMGYSINGLKSIRSGSLRVTLLPSDVIISDEVLKSVHHLEFTRSLAMKSKTRRLEFLRSRVLLHAMLNDTAEIARDPSGFILWPNGLVGSLTHKDGIIAAVVAKAADYRGIGIDIEDTAKVHLGLESRIIAQDELGVLIQLSKEYPKIPRQTWLAAIFSFKEALFKAIYPVGKVFFYFHKAQIVEVDPTLGVISARLLADVSQFTSAGMVVSGHFNWLNKDNEEWVLTSVAI